MGRTNSNWWRRKLSRNSRRARLRTTAPPIRAEVTTPNRDEDGEGNGRQLAIKQPTITREPSCRSRAKSRPYLMRALRPNRSRPGVSAVMI
jgi:hypothetical protein